VIDEDQASNVLTAARTIGRPSRLLRAITPAFDNNLAKKQQRMKANFDLPQYR
jgi:hypothetical protein